MNTFKIYENIIVVASGIEQEEIQFAHETLTRNGYKPFWLRAKVEGKHGWVVCRLPLKDDWKDPEFVRTHIMKRFAGAKP